MSVSCVSARHSGALSVCVLVCDVAVACCVVLCDGVGGSVGGGRDGVAGQDSLAAGCRNTRRGGEPSPAGSRTGQSLQVRDKPPSGSFPLGWRRGRLKEGRLQRAGRTGWGKLTEGRF